MRLIPFDASVTSPSLEQDVGALVASGTLNALCGFHTSDVHRRLERVTVGRIPYLFTPPHEGGRRLPGVALLDEGPEAQLQPILRHLAGRRTLRRWALIGNDYIWPRSVHAAASRLLPRAGARVVLDRLIPFHEVDADRLLTELRRARAQAVLLSVVGRDLAIFNRAFGASGMADRVVRASGALEETGLLEIDGDDTGELYATMSWYASDPADAPFRARYAARWGSTAPPLGAYAQGVYEGVHAIADVAAVGDLTVRRFAPGLARVGRRGRSRLARAEGLDLVTVR